MHVVFSINLPVFLGLQLGSSFCISYCDLDCWGRVFICLYLQMITDKLNHLIMNRILLLQVVFSFAGKKPTEFQITIATIYFIKAH